jgi:hypothetical protein
MSSRGSSCFEMSFVYRKFYNVFSMEDFMDVYWTSQDILKGERVENIRLFHVSGYLEHFGQN